MGGISSTIRLTDAMTPVLTNITSALHMTLNAFEAMQAAASANMDTTSFDAAKASIQEADIALANYKERLNQLNSQPPVPPVPPQPPVPQWENLNTSQIFTNSGAERFTEEINAANSAIRQVLQSQQQISTQAASVNMIPTSALNDFHHVQERIYQVQSAMREIENIPLHMRTDNINNQLEVIREQMQSVGVLQNQISSSIINMDTAGANASLQQLNDMLENVTRHIRDMNTQSITPPWQNISGPQLFMNTGAERFTEEINAANSAMREVLQSQQQISTQAASVNIIPASALNDFNNVEEKFHLLQSTMREIENIPLYMRTDGMNNQIESIRQQMQGVGVLQNQISNSIINMDTTGANASLQQLNDAMDSVMRSIRSINAQQITPLWQSTSDVPVFQNTGSARLQAEINAANTAMQKMLQVQEQVRASSANLRILPPAAQQDITNMGNRVQQLAQKIQQINRIPVSMRTEALNNQIENLRGQFGQATQSMQALNAAMQQGDLSVANAAAQQLNNTLSTAERNIRDNINAQNNFNQSVQQGTAAASGLESMIKRYGAAILSFAGVKKVLNLTDTLTQTTARIAMMQGGYDQVADVQDKVFAAAQRARGNYQAMLDMTAKFGLRAKAAFSNTNETIQFAENLNKMYAIAGATQMEQMSATLQLTQALGSGVLRGQELNAVFNAAPNVIQTVADYLQVDIGKIREMAAEGEITASVVKNALLSATESIDKQFKQMPVTFSQVMTSIANQALMEFQPVMTRISEITSSDRFQSMVNGAINGLTTLASVATEAFDILATGAAWVYDNWNVIEPVVLGVAAAVTVYTVAVNGATWACKAVTIAIKAWTTVQTILNNVLAMNPICIIILAIVTLISILYTVIAIINNVAGTSISATGIIVGALSVALAAIGNLFLALAELVLGVVNFLVNPFLNFANFIGNLFVDPVSAVIYLFQSMADTVLGILETIASALDFVIGTDMAGAVAGWRNDLKSWADGVVADRGFDVNDFNNVVGTLDLSMRDFGFEGNSYSDAWNTGYDWGAALFAEESGALLGVGREAGEDYLNDLLAQGNYNTAAIADSTHDITDSLDINNEDIKYLKDIAERDYINRFTTAENKVVIENISNSVSEAQDLDGMIDYLTEKLVEQVAMSASGIH